ncbi:MAG TPA: InlB B-repeat-containing protein, partial [Anaerovoracaceae bacterium]|nr:InlB B-repeat-containing protein [Anaerovoracaceae bacterium]
DINTTNGEAKYGIDGKVLLYNDGAKLISDKSVLLNAGYDWGSINLEPYSSLEASDNIELTAAEYVVIKGSNLIAGGNIIIESKKKDIAIEDTQISALQMILKSNSVIIGGGWDSGTSVKVLDGKVLTIETGASAVDNAGSIILGNTGGITFDNGMAQDLRNPLFISLTKESESYNKVMISTNYGRSVGYADNSPYEAVSAPGSYQSLGMGQTNLRYTVSQRSGSGSPNLSYSFDGDSIISIDASGTEEEGYTNYYELKVRDGYADEVTGSIVFRVSAMEGQSPDVEVIGQSAPAYTITFDSNGGTPAIPASLAVEAGMQAGTMPQPPSLAGYYFAGWNSKLDGSGSAFNEATIVTGNITVYAQYSSIPIYTVTFDKNGGNTEPIPRTIQVVQGDAIGTLPVPPTRLGYQFLNWSTLANGGSLINELTAIWNDITVYAQWALE